MPLASSSLTFLRWAAAAFLPASRKTFLSASFSLAQCEQLSRAFARAAFLIEQHEASRPQAAPMLEAA